MSRWLWIALGVAALAGVGIAVVGHWSGGLAGLLALLPAGQAKLKAARDAGRGDGATEQARAQTDKANRLRTGLLEEHRRIDVTTDQDVAEIRRRRETQLGQTTTDEEVARWRKRWRPRR